MDKRALLASLSEAMTEAAESEIARPGEAGHCAWCGRAEAVEWRAYGHTWADGTEAGLCGDCGDVYERRGWPSPQYPEDARAALAEAVSGVPVQMGEEPPSGLRAYVEAEGEGTGEPWSHLDPAAVESYRWARWTARPQHAPAEHRAEALARREVRDAERAARDAAHADDAYGFSGSVRTELEDIP